VTGSLLVLVVGVFVWIGFAYIVHWTTWVDGLRDGSGTVRSCTDRSCGIDRMPGAYGRA